MSEEHPRDRRSLPGQASGSHYAQLHAAQSASAPDITGMRLSGVLGILRRRALLVATIAALVFSVAWHFLPRAQTTYEATAVVRLADAAGQLTGGLVAGVENVGAAELISQLHVIRSRAVANEVVELEGLRLQPAGGFSPRLLQDTYVDPTAMADTLWLRFRPSSFSVRGTAVEVVEGEYGEVIEIDGVKFSVRRPPTGEDGLLLVLSHERAIDRLLRQLGARVRGGTNIIDITYSDPDPTRAQRVVNAVAETFKRHNAQGVQSKAQRRRAFLEEQLEQAEADLTAAQRALSAFRTQERPYSSLARLSAEQSGVLSLELRREELAADRRMYKSLLEAVQQSSGEELEDRLRTLVAAPEVGSNPIVSHLHGQLVGYQTERTNLVTGPWGRSTDNPDVERLDALIASTKTQLVNAVQSHVASVDARLRVLDDLHNRSSAIIRGLPEAEAEEMRLLQDVETSRRSADMLRGEFQRARIAEAVEDGQVQMLDLASAAHPLPARNRRQLLALALVMGLMLGSGTALVMENRNTSIRGREDMEGLLRIPGLAVIPNVEGANGRGTGLLGRVVSIRKGDGAAQAGYGDSAQEAYRVLRTNLIFSQPTEKLKTLVVTSPSPGDGKSTTAANLAAAFARQGLRVLLIDCDLRRPRLHTVFGVTSDPGFIDLLVGRVGLPEVERKTKITGLSLVPWGAPHADAAELLLGERARDLFARLSERFDMVVVDTPPLLVAADAASIGAIADGVLLVVRAGTTDRGAAQHALLQLAMVGARVVGAVLNDPESTVRGYGGYYYLI